jgi:APA family basic amino acid/polyamine antiporter
MMAALPWETWARLIAWLIVGMIIYYSYGRHHSKVQQGEPSVVAGAKSGD